jgi:hypothetical protein
MNQVPIITKTPCDPIPQLREAMTRALRTSGVFNFPPNVNLETVQPVYLVNNFPIRKQAFGYTARAVQNLALQDFTLLDTRARNILTGNLTSIYCQVSMDAASRAAQFAANNWIDFWIDYLLPDGTYAPFQHFHSDFTASAGNALILEYNSKLSYNGLARTGYPSPYQIVSNPIIFEKIEVQSPMILVLRIGPIGGGAFVNVGVINIYVYCVLEV